jgi:hypothetical protein
MLQIILHTLTFKELCFLSPKYTIHCTTNLIDGRPTGKINESYKEARQVQTQIQVVEPAF